MSERTVGMFEAGRTWPRADTLAQIERLGLNWPVGYLTEYAARHRTPGGPTTLDQDIAAIMESNMATTMKLRLIDRLRGIDYSDDGDDHESDIDTGIA